MFKDVVVNLSGRGPRDFAADYDEIEAARDLGEHRGRAAERRVENARFR